MKDIDYSVTVHYPSALGTSVKEVVEAVFRQVMDAANFSKQFTGTGHKVDIKYKDKIIQTIDPCKSNS